MVTDRSSVTGGKPRKGKWAGNRNSLDSYSRGPLDASDQTNRHDEGFNLGDGLPDEVARSSIRGQIVGGWWPVAFTPRNSAKLPRTIALQLSKYDIMGSILYISAKRFERHART